jgi:hypothetical protein
MEQIHQFINDPLVAPLYALLVISVLDMLLGIYRSIQQHVFDWQKLPSLLDTTVLTKVIPLAALGAASFFVTDQTAGDALKVAYVGGAAAALAAEVAAFISKAAGSYVATPSKPVPAPAPAPVPPAPAPVPAPAPAPAPVPAPAPEPPTKPTVPAPKNTGSGYKG